MKIHDLSDTRFSLEGDDMICDKYYVFNLVYLISFMYECSVYGISIILCWGGNYCFLEGNPKTVLPPNYMYVTDDGANRAICF